MRIRRKQKSFILRSAQQEEALHRIWYALRSGIYLRRMCLRGTKVLGRVKY
ncbi:unnamed protein product [Spirodela intermedia]|uniref:Uncharacterized protein n=1 Tax=Spirodela intermedia TaxID=51605 RepID=A0A7I8L0C3_SPIIN|nr:unnamed protein product [Spirodela intermedia]